MFASVATAADPPKLPPDLDMVPRDAGGFVSVKVAELWASPKLKAARDLLAKEYPDWTDGLVRRVGLKPEEIARATAVLPTADPPPGSGYVLIVTTVAPYDRAKLTAALKLGPPAGRTAAYQQSRAGDLVFLRDARTLVFVVNAARDADALFALFGPLVNRTPDGPLADALAAAVTHPIAFGTGKLPVEPPDAEKNPLALLFPGTRTLSTVTKVSGTVAVERGLRLTVSVGFPDAAWAARGKRVIGGYLSLLTEWIAERLEEQALGKAAAKADAQSVLAALESATVEADRATVRLAFTSADATVVAGAVSLAFENLAGGAGGGPIENRYKQVGLAWLNYEAANARLPADIHSKDGKPLLSWRVAILPYIEQDELYKQFRLDEPWDSEHNKALLPKMPAVYALPAIDEPGYTYVQSFVGKKGVSPRPVLAAGDAKGMPIAGVTDGLSNTLIVAAAEAGVPWTKPADIPFDPATAPKVGGHTGTTFVVVFADGTVRRLDLNKLPAAGLRALVTANGGEAFRLDQ